MPYTGYAVISYDSVSSSIALPQNPMVESIDEIVLLIEPETEEPIIRTGIHDTWQR